MHELLPHYERELALLQQQAEDFARRHPHIAGRLSATGELLQDPQVQRLVQGFALLASRIHQRLDDDFPRFTLAYLEALWPQVLRPFPSCAIARFDHSRAAAQMSVGELRPPGLVLDTITLHNPVACRFTTTAELQLLPLRVAWAGFSAAAALPGGTALPRQATALLSIRLELASDNAHWARLGTRRLRLFLDAEAPLAALLRETLCGRVLATLAQVSSQATWDLDAACQPRPTGFEDGEALIAGEARWPAAQRLLSEYFAFPDKFNFIDLPLPAAARCGDGRTLLLHYALAAPCAGSEEARLLEQVSARHFVPGCVPVVNLFHANARTAAVAGAPATWTVQPAQPGQDTRCEVYAIDRVRLALKTGDGEQHRPVEPFTSLRHDHRPGPGREPALHWVARRESAAADAHPGREMTLTLVDSSLAPATLPEGTLSVELRATHGDLPRQLRIGNPGGDLGCAGGGNWDEIRLLRPPTPLQRPDLAAGTAWRLISLLSPRHLSLTGQGLDALKEALHLHDPAHSPHTEQLLQGLAGVEARPVQACLASPDGPAMVRGTEIRLCVHEDHFAGRGLDLFARVLSRWFARHAHTNSFTQLRLVSARTGAVLLTCPRQTGDVPLV